MGACRSSLTLTTSRLPPAAGGRVARIRQAIWLDLTRPPPLQRHGALEIADGPVEVAQGDPAMTAMRSIRAS